MIVKELIEELKKYPEDTKIYIENYCDDFGITYLDEPWINFETEIKYDEDEDWRKSYASYLKCDWILENVLIIK